MGCRAGVIEGRENPRWAAFFNQVTHDLVVEILDRGPLNFFPNVFLLFSLEGEFNKDLLQLFVNIIDAELFERVVLESRFSGARYMYESPQTSKISKPKISW